MNENARVRSSDLQPGTRLQYKPDPDSLPVVLDRRKQTGDSEFGMPGWWLTDGVGGIADCVIDDPDSDWLVLSAVSGSEPEAPNQ
jgi:hypothetical protein